MKRQRLAAVVVLSGVLASGLGACAGQGQQEIVRVPADAATISDAVDRVAEDGLILVAPGTYPEEVLIDKPGVTLRGEDRNAVVIDAEGQRPYGVVGVAPGVTVQNITVTGATFYGVLMTGMFTEDDGPSARENTGYTTLDPEKFPPLQRFLVDHVTATNNGLYGIYAFDAQNGVIRDSYASGSADSGIYVGQCRECNVLVHGNIAENNAVGFENANASDSVWVVSNDFSGNRIGMTFLSNYQEAFAPQRGNWVAGNIVSENTSVDSPAHAQGGWGIGIGLSGANDNLFERNRIEGNPAGGVSIDNAEDLASRGNRFVGNVFAYNGVDFVNTSDGRAPASGNCVDGHVTALPTKLFARCDGEQPAAAAGGEDLEVPPGMSYLKVPKPGEQGSLPVSDEVPAPLPKTQHAPESSSVLLPAGR